MRQLLADKLNDNLLGLWLLVPEHLRLGTWDLVTGWSGQSAEQVEPRLGLQLIHEAALCRSGVRANRSLTQKGLAVLNGLPFLGSDEAIHHLLSSHTVQEGERLQVALAKLRRTLGHFRGKLLAIDPHRMASYSKRHMRRHRKDERSRPRKVSQTYFCLDADTKQPVCFTISSASRTVTQATPELLKLAAEVLLPEPGSCLVLADSEHFTAELLDRISTESPFNLLVPMSKERSLLKRLAAIPAEEFTHRWAGYATAKLPYRPTHSTAGPYYQFVQRLGARSEDWRFNSFACTADLDEVDALSRDYPQRGHIEEFFNAEQSLGWKRGGTLNLNIRYGQMSMALVAQAVIHQLRTRLPEPFSKWNAESLATSLFQGLDGDLRVQGDTIIVTYYNAPHADLLRQHYEGLPEKLAAQQINPRIPWLYNYQLDFRFR